MRYAANAKPSDACIFVPYRLCRYWDTGDQCKFCDLNYNTKLQMKLAKEAGMKASARSSMEEIYETTLEILKEEGRWRHLCITGGSDPKAGYENEFEYYLNCSKSIQKAFKEFCGIEQIPLYLVLSPYTEEQMKRLKEEAGVTRFAPNLEVWDKEMLSLVCRDRLGKDALTNFVSCDITFTFADSEAFKAEPPPGFEDLALAIEGASPITMIYEGGTKGLKPRDITPLGLMQRNGIVYPSAFCHIDKIEKSFRMDRIRGFKIHKEYRLFIERNRLNSGRDPTFGLVRLRERRRTRWHSKTYDSL